MKKCCSTKNGDSRPVFARLHEFTILLRIAPYEGVVFSGDFGLARKGKVDVHGQADPMIASHIKGTLAYLPPEFTKNRQLSTKLDVYSFGVVS